MGQGHGWGKNIIDNPYVVVHQLKTHMFLLIITHTAHEKMGYFPHQSRWRFAIYYNIAGSARAGDWQFPATPREQHCLPQTHHNQGSAMAQGPREFSSSPGFQDAISWPFRFAGNSNWS